MSDCMPKYQWNYQEIKENRNTLQQMYHKELDITEKENIKEIIEMYDNMLSLMFKTSNNYINDDFCFDDIKNFLDNHLMDIIKLPHELFHYVFCDCDVFTSCNYSTYYLSEIEGSFANILFGDYYYKQATVNPNFFNLNFLKLYNDHIEAIVTNNALLDSISNNKIRMNKLNKYLNYFDLSTFQNPTEIVDYLSTPLEILIKYAFGYLIAIDLYTMYQNDPEFSFYLLKNLKFIKRENDIIHLLRNNHITFMDNGYENLKKYTKKIERQN